MSLDVLEQLNKLGDLRTKGILTDNEFKLKKMQLLNEQNFYNKPNTSKKMKWKGSYWLPIPSMTFSIIAMLASFGISSEVNYNEIQGVVVFSVAGFVLGISSISLQTKGKGMAITGVTLSSIVIVVLIGLIIK